MEIEKKWCVYLLLCEGGSFYAGVTNDLHARFETHRRGRGARYTRAHPPLKIIVTKEFADRSSAQKAEWAVKQLPKHKKQGYLSSLATA